MTLTNMIKTIFSNFSNQQLRDSYNVLRDPARLPKCYDLTDTERQSAIIRLNRNVWNDHSLTAEDQYKIDQ